MESLQDLRFGVRLEHKNPLFAVFCLLALLLAAICVHDLKADSVAQRTREIGICTALEARAAQFLRPK